MGNFGDLGNSRNLGSHERYEIDETEAEEPVVLDLEWVVKLSLAQQLTRGSVRCSVDFRHEKDDLERLINEGMRGFVSSNIQNLNGSYDYLYEKVFDCVRRIIVDHLLEIYSVESVPGEFVHIVASGVAKSLCEYLTVSPWKPLVKKAREVRFPRDF